MIFSASINTFIKLKILQENFSIGLTSEGGQNPIAGETSEYLQSLASAGFLIPDHNHNGYFYILILLIVGYILARTFLGSLSNSTFMAAISYNTTASLFKDNSQLQRQRDIVLYSFYFVSMGFYSMLLMERFALHPFQFTNYRLLLFSIVCLSAIFFSRVLVANIIGHVFSELSLFREFLYHGFSFNKLMGILFLPMNFLIVYTVGVVREIVIWVSVSILIAMILLKIARGINFAFKKRIFNFYLFLYLCALEMVPLLVLYKWFTNIVLA